MTSRTALPPNPLHAPERALPPKTRLDEFEIEAVLAQSSFAVVYRAYDHVLKLHVAIKEYLPDALALRSAETQVVLRARVHAERFEQGLQAFVAEAQTLARCEHPALQRVSRLLLRHGTAYRVMRYCPGPTLLEHRRALGATPDAASVRGWLEALLGALDTLHEEGGVHGAVAPGNILLLPDDRPLLLDFEAVRRVLISDRTQSMMAALEPCYEPVEQRAPTADSSTGPWTDLYALAATLHFCISGQLPAPPMAEGTGQRFEPLPAVWQRLRQTQPGLGGAPGWLGRARRQPAARRPAGAPAERDCNARVAGCAERGRRRAAARRVAAGGAAGGAGAGGGARRSASAAVAGPGPAPDSAGHAAGDAAACGAAAVRRRPPPPPQPSPPPRVAASADTGAAIDSAHAKVLADLDKTLAFIAAQASEEAQPKSADAAGTQGAPFAAGAPAADPLAAGEGEPAAAAPEAGAEPKPLKPLTQRQLVLAGVAVAGDAGGDGCRRGLALKDSQPELFGDAPSATLQSAVAPQGNAAPVDDATAKALQAAEAALSKSPPRAGPPPSGSVASSIPVAPAAPVPTAPAPAVAKPKGPATPREACGERTRFSLYQCMQTQCAKKTWSKHAQCVQLRKDQKL